MAPTGALEEAILYVRPCVRASVRPSVCPFPQKNTANEFLKHSKESRGVLGQASRQASRQVSRKANRKARRQASRKASRKVGKQESRQARKQAGRKEGKQASR